MIYSCAEGPSQLFHPSIAPRPSLLLVFSSLSSSSGQNSLCRRLNSEAHTHLQRIIDLKMQVQFLVLSPSFHLITLFFLNSGLQLYGFSIFLLLALYCSCKICKFTREKFQLYSHYGYTVVTITSCRLSCLYFFAVV